MKRKTGRNRLKRLSAVNRPVEVSRESMTPQEFRDLRVAARLTQTQLAERLGIGFTAVNRKENGRSPITVLEARFMRGLARLERAS